MDRDWPDEADHRLVADQYGDHREHDGTGEAGEIAELAGAEAKTLVVGMPTRVAIGQRGQEQRTRMRRHVQPVGDECDRAEQQAANDLRHHHGRAKRNHNPGAALVALVALAQEDVAVGVGKHVARSVHFK
jgi:hypothetical protein